MVATVQQRYATYVEWCEARKLPAASPSTWSKTVDSISLHWWEIVDDYKGYDAGASPVDLSAESGQ